MYPRNCFEVLPNRPILKPFVVIFIISCGKETFDVLFVVYVCFGLYFGEIEIKRELNLHILKAIFGDKRFPLEAPSPFIIVTTIVQLFRFRVV